MEGQTVIGGTPVSEGGAGPTGGEDGGPGPRPAIPDAGRRPGGDSGSSIEAGYHYVRLVIADVPASRIADVNRGIFLPLSNLVDGGLTFSLEIDVTSAEGIPARTLEQTIKETVRQIGARVVEEEKG